MPENITGIVMAGGTSRRMGQDKGLMLLGNEPLTAWSVNIIKPLSHSVVISTNNPAYRQFGFPLVPDIIPGIGPMGGIMSCLEHSATDMNIFISCDTPFINPGLFSHLLLHLEDNDAALPWFGGDRYEPVCGIYRKSILPALRRFARRGNYKLPDLFGEVGISRVPIRGTEAFYHPYLFFNVNTPEKLSKAADLLDRHMIPLTKS